MAGYATHSQRGKFPVLAIPLRLRPILSHMLVASVDQSTVENLSLDDSKYSDTLNSQHPQKPWLSWGFAYMSGTAFGIRVP